MTVKAEPLSRNIERTLVYSTPPGTPDMVALHQVVTFKREPVTDAKGTITGYTPWQAHQKQWPAVPVPQLPGYRSNLRIVPAMSVTPEAKDTKLTITYTKDAPKDVTPTKPAPDQASTDSKPDSAPTERESAVSTVDKSLAAHKQLAAESKNCDKQVAAPSTAEQVAVDVERPQEKQKLHHHVYPVVTPIPLSQANAYLRCDTEIAHILVTLVERGALQWRHDEYHTLFFAQS